MSCTSECKMEPYTVYTLFAAFCRVFVLYFEEYTRFHAYNFGNKNRADIPLVESSQTILQTEPTCSIRHKGKIRERGETWMTWQVAGSPWE